MLPQTSCQTPCLPFFPSRSSPNIECGCGVGLSNRHCHCGGGARSDLVQSASPLSPPATPPPPHPSISSSSYIAPLLIAKRGFTPSTSRDG
ncbi:hypothetical protein J6590_034222 [Homalodisca vitripennis]|nr:hypothetical protein J6590_034222 [Homalodisca vitripennis]